MIHVIDHKHRRWSIAKRQLQAVLALKGFENRDPALAGRQHLRAAMPFQIEVPSPIKTRGINHRFDQVIIGEIA